MEADVKEVLDISETAPYNRFRTMTRRRAEMMDGRALRRMILPLFLEQLLVALVGLADVFVVGFVGEAAVSGVSLVNSFNTIFINLFTALASGGAVVISQYIGRNERENAGRAASQLLAQVAWMAAPRGRASSFQTTLGWWEAPWW